MGQNNGTKLLCFLMGLTVGAIAGMALAPHPGVETRRAIGHQANRARDLYQRGRLLADEAAEMFDEGRRFMEDRDA